MKKMQLEITTALASVILLVLLIAASKLIIPASPGYGYGASLLVFILIMGIVGLKLARIPD